VAITAVITTSERLTLHLKGGCCVGTIGESFFEHNRLHVASRIHSNHPAIMLDRRLGAA
jgi:hypothetical protein